MNISLQAAGDLTENLIQPLYFKNLLQEKISYLMAHELLGQEQDKFLFSDRQ